jgi:hypothetical protein
MIRLGDLPVFVLLKWEHFLNRIVVRTPHSLIAKIQYQGAFLEKPSEHLSIMVP